MTPPSSELQHSDVLCTDRYLHAFPDDYCKTDILEFHQEIMWRGELRRIPKFPRRRLITGHSGYPITDELVDRYPVDKWYGVNAIAKKVIGLPLGITNYCDDGPRHRLLGDISQILYARTMIRARSKLLYLNFNPSTYNVEREALYRNFSNLSFVTAELPRYSAEGRLHYLQQMRNHRFVLCPRGSGIDTHRLWEALYVGATPIVKYDPVHRGWRDLPILFVEDWSQVTEEFLLHYAANTPVTDLVHKKLTTHYWIDLISTGQSGL